MILQKYTQMNELFEYVPVSDKEFFPMKRTEHNWAQLYGVDLTGCNIRIRRKNNYSPDNTGCVQEELSDINRWNSGYWAAVLISPRHAVACAHYWRVVPNQQNDLKFWGKSGTEYLPTFKKVYDIGNDRVIIEFEDDLPVNDVKIYKIVDFRWIPSGTKLWIHDNQGRVLYKIHDTVREWKYPAYNYQQLWHPDPVVGDICTVFSGDSGSPTFMTDPVTNETYFVGNFAGGYQYYEDRAMEQGLKNIDSRIRFVKPSDSRGDVNRDGVVDGADLAQVLENFGAFGYLNGDIDRNGVIDSKDMGSVLSDWGPAKPNVEYYDDWYGGGSAGNSGETSGTKETTSIDQQPTVNVEVKNTSTNEPSDDVIINQFSYRKL